MRQHNQGRNRQTSCPSYQSVYRQCAVVGYSSALPYAKGGDIQRLLGCSLESLETNTAFRCLGRLSVSHWSRYHWIGRPLNVQHSLLAGK